MKLSFIRRGLKSFTNAGCLFGTAAVMITSVVAFTPLLRLMAVFSMITFSVGLRLTDRTVNQAQSVIDPGQWRSSLAKYDYE